MELEEARGLVKIAITAELAGDDYGCSRALSAQASSELEVSLAIASALNDGTVVDRLVGAHLLRQVWEVQTSPKPIELAKTLLAGEDEPAVIAALLMVLGRSRISAYSNVILDYLDHPSELVRYGVSDSIASFSPEAWVRDALLLLARDAEEDVRCSAVFELGAWLHTSRDPEILEVLMEIAKSDVSRDVRERAVDSLGGA